MVMGTCGRISHFMVARTGRDLGQDAAHKDTTPVT